MSHFHIPSTSHLITPSCPSLSSSLAFSLITMWFVITAKVFPLLETSLPLFYFSIEHKWVGPFGFWLSGSIIIFKKNWWKEYFLVTKKMCLKFQENGIKGFGDVKWFLFLDEVITQGFSKSTLYYLAISSIVCSGHQYLWICDLTFSWLPNTTYAWNWIQIYRFEINLFTNASRAIISNVVVKIMWEQCNLSKKLDTQNVWDWRRKEKIPEHFQKKIQTKSTQAIDFI